MPSKRAKKNARSLAAKRGWETRRRKAAEAEARKRARSLAAKKGHETRRRKAEERARKKRLRTPMGRAAEKLKFISRPKKYWDKRKLADDNLPDILDVAEEEGVDVHELFGVLMSPEAA